MNWIIKLVLGMIVAGGGGVFVGYLYYYKSLPYGVGLPIVLLWGFLIGLLMARYIK